MSHRQCNFMQICLFPTVLKPGVLLRYVTHAIRNQGFGHDLKMFFKHSFQYLTIGYFDT